MGLLISFVFYKYFIILLEVYGHSWKGQKAGTFKSLAVLVALFHSVTPLEVISPEARDRFDSSEAVCVHKFIHPKKKGIYLL